MLKPKTQSPVDLELSLVLIMVLHIKHVYLLDGIQINLLQVLDVVYVI
jgi:hypothetical protein